MIEIHDIDRVITIACAKREYRVWGMRWLKC